MGLAILLSITMIILLAKNYRPLEDGTDHYLAAFQRVCEDTRRMGQTSFVISVDSHLLCFIGEPRYNKWETKIIVKREDLK